MADEVKNPPAPKPVPPAGNIPAAKHESDPAAPAERELLVPGSTNASRSDETIPGGCYIQDVVVDRATGKHYGGRLVNAHGETLATFEPDQENTGRVEDGKRPERKH